MSIGIDLVQISRFEGKEHLVTKILSKEEQALYQTRVNKAEFLAGRFAAKEAFAKALKLGITGVPLREISILNAENGAPLLHYQNQTYPVSIAHDGDYAVAIVILESKETL